MIHYTMISIAKAIEALSTIVFVCTVCAERNATHYSFMFNNAEVFSLFVHVVQ